ncbi:MAG: hypothetical protein Q9212_001534 [Teloschistes hypoglaucus]
MRTETAGDISSFRTHKYAMKHTIKEYYRQLVDLHINLPHRDPYEVETDTAKEFPDWTKVFEDSIPPLAEKLDLLEDNLEEALEDIRKIEFMREAPASKGST